MNVITGTYAPADAAPAVKPAAPALIRPLLVREWLKTWRYFCGVLAVNLAGWLFFWLELRRQLRLEHAEMVWYRGAHLGSVFFEDLRYLPLLAGIVIAAAQVVPELGGRRLRLMLHLPHHRDLLLGCWIGIGSLLYLGVALIDLALVLLVMRLHFPAEFLLPSMLTLTPWLLAGWFGYAGVLAVLLEPALGRRLFVLVACLLALPLYFQGSGYGWLAPALPWLPLPVAGLLLGVFAACHRYRERGDG